MTDDELLTRAIELAETHSADGVHGPFGAVVARGGEIIGEGWNRVVAGRDPTAHAEVVAIRDASERTGTHDLGGTTIYASCEPCPMCLGAIYWAGVTRVVYACDSADARDAGFGDAEFYDELRRRWGERRVAGEQRLRERGLEALRAWTANARRVEY